jgi:PPM family protein phosphatase
MEAPRLAHCASCGGSSRDFVCCEFCNSNLTPVSPPPAPMTCPLAPEGPLFLSAQQAGLLTRPEASVTLFTPEKSWRLHWIGSEVWPDWKPVVESRLTCSSSTLPRCRLVEDLTGHWVVAEAGGHRPEPWQLPAAEDPLDRLRQLAGVAGRGKAFWDDDPAGRLGEMVTFLERLSGAMESLHAVGCVWLPFHPQTLEETAGGLRSTSMDLAVNPFTSLADYLRTVPSFTAPEVAKGQIAEIGPRTDVFHLALLTYYWLGRYLPHGFPGKGLASFDFTMPPLRILAPSLPPGIASVVMSGLAMEPWRRPVSPRAFCEGLQAAVEKVRTRQAASTPLGWEIGVHTRTGRTKGSRGGVNQDAVLYRQFENPARALLVVADGLSCCDVGSGDVASRLVCETIDASFDAKSHAEHFSQRIPAACLRGAEAILAWALDRGERLRLIAAQDLMSTTVLAAWLEGDTLIIANAGDSRAYLLNEQGIEQLTVDADLGCTLLAAGSPPENVVELGPVTRALRSCVGGVLYKSATEELVADDSRFKLAIGRWKLLPGETVILCSDGLVEEGAFLEPAELWELVQRHADLPVNVLAETLAEAADARQIVPSEEEPEGCGDNISCCVIRVKGRAP